MRLGSVHHKAVLLALANYHHDATGDCNPSLDTITRWTNANRKTVSKSIRWLADSGLISIEKRSRTSVLYHLNFDASEPVETVKRGDLSRIDSGNQSSPTRGPTLAPRVDLVGHEKAEIAPKSPGLGPPVDLAAGQGTRSTDDPRLGPPVDHERDNGKDYGDKSPCQTSEKPEAEKYVRFAEFMWCKIAPITKQTKPPDFQKWAKQLRLLTTADGYREEYVRKVFVWANKHDFWSSVILSATNLRKKFPQLVAKFEREKTHGRDRLQGATAQDRNRASLRDATHGGDW